MKGRISPRITPLPAHTFESLKGVDYDAAIASLGFETRCRQIPEALGVPANTAVLAFGDRHELDFAKNNEWFKSHKWQIVEINDEKVIAWVVDWLRDLCSDRSTAVRVAVDVSSMSRLRIAGVIEAVLSLPREARIEMDLLYTPSQFKPPDHGKEPLVYDIAPVSDYFAGWWADLDASLLAIIGVGYELEKAASVIDKLEPEQTLVFSPQGEDAQYADEVGLANEALMRTKGVIAPPVPYEVADPFACFSEIESMLSELGSKHRVAVVPLGPKIFAACAMLASALHSETSQVIRVTAGTRQRAENRVSSGKVYGLGLSASPSPTTA
jgi:hypothetical protein